MRKLITFAIAAMALPAIAPAQQSATAGRTVPNRPSAKLAATGNSGQSYVGPKSRRTGVRGATPSRPGRTTVSASTTSGPPATGTAARPAKKAGTSPDLTGH